MNTDLTSAMRTNDARSHFGGAAPSAGVRFVRSPFRRTDVDTERYGPVDGDTDRCDRSFVRHHGRTDPARRFWTGPPRGQGLALLRAQCVFLGQDHYVPGDRSVVDPTDD